MDDYVQTVLNSYPQVLVGMPRIAPYENAYRNWVHEIEGIVRYGNSGSTAFHPQIAGTPGRAVMFRRFCEYLAENKDVWCAPCEEIARYLLLQRREMAYADRKTGVAARQGLCGNAQRKP